MVKVPYSLLTWYIFILFVTADDKSCSNHCSIDDKDNGLTCFQGSQAHYDSVVVQALQDWLAVEDDIQQWHFRNNTAYKGYNTTVLKAATLARWKELLQDIDKPLLDEPTIKAVADSLVVKIQQTRVLDPPEFTCPVPCEYKNQLWKYMFIASALLNAALFASVIPFMIISLRQERRLYEPQK